MSQEEKQRISRNSRLDEIACKWLETAAACCVPELPFRPPYLAARSGRRRCARLSGRAAAFLNTGIPNNANGSPLRMLLRALPLNGS